VSCGDGDECGVCVLDGDTEMKSGESGQFDSEGKSTGDEGEQGKSQHSSLSSGTAMKSGEPGDVIIPDGLARGEPA
jgi:hypothetical protein